MKILVTNHWLKKLGGSETFTYALIAALKKAGHDVDLFTNQPGLVSDRIATDLKVYCKRLKDSYDLILANHNTCVRSVYDRGPVIQTCHGIYPKLEQPSDLANAWVSISREVKNYLKSLGKESTLIYNGIDCNRFKPVKPPEKKIRKVLSLSHSEELNNILASMLANYRVKLVTINKYRNPVWEIESLMQQCDLVISLGRGAYEAMACGCAVLVLDYRPYMKAVLGDGIITRDNINDLMLNNCSGRRLMRNDVREMLTESFDKYSPEMCEYNRYFAVNNLNITEKVNRYLNVLSCPDKAG
jgi:glycosyltransferase involved in cell wall biosynthesis